MEERKVLLIQARNLGDAVISTGLVETVARNLPGSRIDVVTRPEIAQIFTANPLVQQVFTGRFPMGSLHDFGLKEAMRLSGMAWRLRREKYTDVVNIEGDFREEAFGALVTRGRNWTPAWSPGHPCSKVIRQSVIPLANAPVPIPLTSPNVHDATAILGEAVTGAEGRKPALYTRSKTRVTWAAESRAIGIHPMASQPWRRWEFEKWTAVAGLLIERGFDVSIFGSPAEAEELKKHFGHLDAAKLSIVTGSLPDYFAAVAKMRVLLCPDSFASHVAYALGVPTILLNGANDAEAWAPPGTTVLAKGPELTCYPCYNRPTCTGGADEYACVRRITEDEVLASIREVLRSSGGPQLAGGREAKLVSLAVSDPE